MKLTPLQQAIMLLTIVSVVAVLYLSNYCTIEIILVCTLAIVFFFQMFAIQSLPGNAREHFSVSFNGMDDQDIILHHIAPGLDGDAPITIKTDDPIWPNLRNVRSPLQPECDKVSDLVFKTKPDVNASNPQNGYAMYGNELRGPKSDQLKIDINKCLFSMTVKAKAVPSSPITLMKVYANPIAQRGDNAIEIKVLKVPDDDSKIQFKAYIGLGEIIATSEPAIMLPDTPYTFIFQKRGNAVKMHWIMLSSPQSIGSFVVFDKRIECNTLEMTLANKTSMFCYPSGSWDFNALTLLLGNVELDDGGVAEFVNSMKQMLLAHDKYYKMSAELEKENQRMKACPFDKATCDKCETIKDWSNYLTTLTNTTTDECKACGSAINEFCRSNPDHHLCTCWDISNPYYDTTCRHVRAIVDSSTGLAILPLGDKPKEQEQEQEEQEDKEKAKEDAKEEAKDKKRKECKKKKECTECRNPLPKKAFLDVITHRD